MCHRQPNSFWSGWAAGQLMEKFYHTGGQNAIFVGCSFGKASGKAEEGKYFLLI